MTPGNYQMVLWRCN